ncbi:MAG: methyl-accepting chemotaxis protein [Lachnospiraceae bacterium]|nr:methyl-accepting chemotaxis protein [Lachnospiraceae bacterium]
MKVRKISFSWKLFLAVMILLLCSVVVMGTVTYRRAKKLLVEQIKGNAVNVDRCVAASVDGDLLERIQVGDEESETYQTVLEQLTLYRDNSGVEYVYTLRKEAGGMVFVVDSDPEEPASVGDAFEDDGEEVSKALRGESVASANPYTDEWGTHLSAYSPIYNQSGQIVGLAAVDLSVDWVNEQTGRLLVLIVGVCVVVLLLGAAVLFVISRALRTGFVTLNDKLVDICEGDGDLTRVIELNSGDEFETIGGNVNKLLEQIRKILQDIAKESNSLKTTSGDIAGRLLSTKDNASDVSTTMEEMSASMQQVAASLGQVNDLMGQITDAFDDIVDRIKDGSDSAKEMHRSAEQVRKQAQTEQDEASAKMQEMARNVAESIERSHAVEKISVLTENIIAITDQTNLLSLNASIEAARAGEAGRGFAVVASEIGNLAQDSAQSAAEIQAVSTDVISAVDGLAGEAKRLIEFMNTTAMNGYTDLVTTSGEYRKSAEQMDGMMQEFAQISSRIQENINSIHELTASVNTAVEETAKGVLYATEKTVDISHSVQEIGDDAQTNSNISDALYGDVNRFRLG